MPCTPKLPFSSCTRCRHPRKPQRTRGAFCGELARRIHQPRRRSLTRAHREIRRILAKRCEPFEPREPLHDERVGEIACALSRRPSSIPGWWSANNVRRGPPPPSEYLYHAPHSGPRSSRVLPPPNAHTRHPDSSRVTGWPPGQGRVRDRRRSGLYRASLPDGNAPRHHDRVLRRAGPDAEWRLRAVDRAPWGSMSWQT